MSVIVTRLLELGPDNGHVLAVLRRHERLQVITKAGWLFSTSIADDELEDAYLIACLYAWHENHAKNGNLAASLSQLNNTNSAENRLRILVERSRQQLADQLRYAVKQLASHGIAIDWYKLWDDLRDWNRVDKRVQEQWMITFWKLRED